MIRGVCFSFFLIIGQSGFCQQIPLYNQYHLAPLIYNPSYTGFTDGVSIALIRNQKWGNYGDGFIANSLSVGTLLRDNKSGLGISLYNDYAGITSKLNAHLLYSYRIQLGEKANIRMGIGAGIIDNRIDFTGAIVSDPNDPVVTNTLGNRKTMFDMNVGFNFNYADFRIGVSVPQVLGTKLIYSDANQSHYTLERQLISNIGYSWYLNREKGILINPEALIIYSFPGAPLNYNINLIFELEKIAWVGVAYKSNYAVSFNLGLNIVKNLKFGLAYDFQINSVATYNSRPNVELMLKYSIPPKIQKVEDNTEMEKQIAGQQRQLDSLNNVIRTNETSAQNKIQDLENANKVLEDSLTKWPKNSTISIPPVDTTNTVDIVRPIDTAKTEVVPTHVNESEIKSNSDDYFVELSGKDTPNGYYVISGAFAEKSNADALLRKIKGKFPSARIIMNKRNNLYYVILYHSAEKGEGLAYASYKAKSGLVEETWVLEYTKKP